MTWFVCMVFITLSCFVDSPMDGVRLALGAVALAILNLAERK